MKKPFFITVVIFLLFTNALKAQKELLGTSSSSIREIMKTQGYQLIRTGKTDDGEGKYINFYLASQQLTFFFDIGGDECLKIMEFRPKTLLPTILNYLNKFYIKINKSTYESFDNKYLIKLSTSKLTPENLIILYSFLEM